MGEFVGAGPQHAHRCTGDQGGDDGGVECGVVGAVMAVAAGAMGMVDDDGLRIALQRAGGVGAEWIDALDVAPHLQDTVVLMRNGA